MSVAAINSPAQTKTSRISSRHWAIAVLTVLTACGVAYWWTNRLTPDERIIVGRWEVVYGPLGSSQTSQVIVDYHSDRTTYSGGIMSYWKADDGLIRYENDRPYLEKAFNFATRAIGLSKKQQPDFARYKILNNNKIITDSEIGKTQFRCVWTRIADQ